MKRRYRLNTHHYPILEDTEILHSNSKKLTIALLKKSFRNDEQSPKRLFIISDGSLETLEALRTQLKELEEFKNKSFKIITSDNQERERETINNFAKGIIDFDVLMSTSVLSIGIRLNGLFDMTVVDTSNNPERIWTDNEVMQMMTRDADCPIVIWQQPRYEKLPNLPINWKIPEPADWKNVSQQEWENISKKIEIIYKPKRKLKEKNSFTNLFERNPITNLYEPKQYSIIKRTVKQHNWSIENRTHIIANTKAHAERLGVKKWYDLEETRALLDERELREIKLTPPKYIQEELNKKLLGKLEHDADSLAKLNEILEDLRIDTKSQHLTAKQLSQWDSKGYIDNECRHKELHSAISNPSELNQLALELLQLGKDYGKMKILTDAQFKQSEVFKEYFDGDNFARFQRLAQDSFGLYEPKKLQTQLDALRWSGELLRKFNYYPQLKTEAQTNPNSERKNLYQQAKKEHSAQFNKWAKANRTEGKQIRYDDWLWFMLNDKELREFKFKPLTRKYIQTFPHLEIQEHTRRFNAHVV